MARKTRITDLTLDELESWDDGVSATLYGDSPDDGELPLLEKHIREQTRLASEMEAMHETSMWSIGVDPAELLEMKQEGEWE